MTIRTPEYLTTRAAFSPATLDRLAREFRHCRSMTYLYTGPAEGSEDRPHRAPGEGDRSAGAPLTLA